MILRIVLTFDVPESNQRGLKQNVGYFLRWYSIHEFSRALDAILGVIFGFDYQVLIEGGQNRVIIKFL